MNVGADTLNLTEWVYLYKEKKNYGMGGGQVMELVSVSTPCNTGNIDDRDKLTVHMM